MAFKTTPPPDWMIDRFLKKKKTKSKPKGLRKSPPQISTQVQGIDHSIPGSIEIDNNAIRGVNLRKRFTLSAFNDEIVMKYQLMWGEIALNIDKKLFYGFIFLTFISPILVIIAWEATE